MPCRCMPMQQEQMCRWLAAAVVLANVSPWFEAALERWSEQGERDAPRARADTRGRSSSRSSGGGSASRAPAIDHNPCRSVYMDVGSAEEAEHLVAALKQVRGAGGWRRGGGRAGGPSTCWWPP